MSNIWKAILKFLEDRGFDWCEWALTLHFFFSFVGILFLKGVCGMNVWYAGAFVALFGIIKELYDWKIGSTGFSWEDLAYDALGVFLGVMFCL